MADEFERDVFISHEKHDSDVALELASRLRAVGYSTWCYEEDSTAGSYLVQIDRAIEAARSMVVIVSPHSLRSPHVRNEVVRAYESQKRFVPIRRNMAHEDVLKAQDAADDDRRREWRMAFGAAVSVPWNSADPQSVANIVADGLRRAGLTPGRPATPYVPTSYATPIDGSPRASEIPRVVPVPDAPFDAREAGAHFVADLGLPSDMPALRSAMQTPMARVAAAAFVGGIGVFGNFQTLFGTIAPGPTDWSYMVAPASRIANLVGSVLGLWLSVRLSRAALVLFRGDSSGEIEVRRVTSLELLLIGVWFVVMVGITLVGFQQGAETARAPMLEGAMRAGLTAGIPVAILRRLFAKPSNVEKKVQA